ncbi:MAG: lactate utilization protein [Deltaproteobacteria bacterium]|jgi:hypothetical protein|nr:lactate utilization protein [Deltaproteobacteria bacterium]
MNPFRQWHNETLGKRTVAALEKNNFTASYFPDGESAVLHLLDLVPEGASVGMGGSETSKALNLGAGLASKKCVIHDHNLPGLSVEERNRIRYRQMTSDVFICSSNAVTLKGELVNTDGMGNRVAAMIFGPKKVIVVAGTNKIVRNLDEADKRIKLTAAPINNRRIGTQNPCVRLGECADCNNDTRLCNITAVISRRPPLTDFHVLILGLDLGF